MSVVDGDGRRDANGDGSRGVHGWHLWLLASDEEGGDSEGVALPRR